MDEQQMARELAKAMGWEVIDLDEWQRRRWRSWDGSNQPLVDSDVLWFRTSKDAWTKAWNPFSSLDDLRPVLEEIERRGVRPVELFERVVREMRQEAGLSPFYFMLAPLSVLATAAHSVLCGDNKRQAREGE